MKEILDATPKNLISKVFLEEKVFQTWYDGRSVLIGDESEKLEVNSIVLCRGLNPLACHKLLPGAGQGAVMAMKDAVVIANCIYNMKDLSDESIKSAFASYYRQRYPESENVIKTSSIFTKVMCGH
ncbi:hypothetical protein BGZ80_007955, partial [Entomortierella chlamydospora]